MFQKFQKNATEENFQDPLVKLMSQEREEKTGIEKVKELIEFEYFDEAIMTCNSVLSVNKKDYPHMIQKLRAYVKATKYDNENILPLIMELEKQYPQCLRDVEYAEAKYDYYLNTNSYAKAEELQTVLKQIYGEKNSKLDAAIAQLHIKRGKYNDALDIIDRGLAQNEFDGLLYELKGDIYNYQFGRQEDALVQYKFSMQMNKRNPSLFEKMATLLYNKNYYEDTVQYATVTLEQIRSAKDKNHLTQQQRHCILLRGSSYIYLKQFEEAQNNFQRILDFDEKCIQSRMGKAYACMYKGKSDQAVAIFKKGEELNASYPDYGSFMGLAYFLRKGYDNCEIQLKKYFKKFNYNQEGSNQQQPKNIFNLLNYVNFFYLDESYAKSSMEKVFSTLDISTFKLSDIDLHFIENLSSYEGIKKFLLEYLQNLILYLATGLYRWYPEDLYVFLSKHKENQEVSQKISHIYSTIDRNKQTAKQNYQQRIQLYSDKLNNEQDDKQLKESIILNQQHQVLQNNLSDNAFSNLEQQITENFQLSQNEKAKNLKNQINEQNNFQIQEEDLKQDDKLKTKEQKKINQNNEKMKNQIDKSKNQNQKDCQVRQNSNDDRLITYQRLSIQNQKPQQQPHQIKIQSKQNLKNNQLDLHNVEKNSQTIIKPVDQKIETLPQIDSKVKYDTQRQVESINVSQHSQQIEINKKNEIINKLPENLYQNFEIEEIQKECLIQPTMDAEKKQQIDKSFSDNQLNQETEDRLQKKNQHSGDQSVKTTKNLSNNLISVKEQLLKNQSQVCNQKDLFENLNENFKNSNNKQQSENEIKEQGSSQKILIAEQNSSQLTFSQNYFKDEVKEPSKKQGRGEFHNTILNQETSKELNQPQQQQSENQSVMKNNNNFQTPQQIKESSCCSIF
ncbi:hypothetical protein ABPG72_007734 [Tetrahymena utriculariae]